MAMAAPTEASTSRVSLRLMDRPARLVDESLIVNHSAG
jgi:hypothetical protein